jgi:hypothetical protein
MIIWKWSLSQTILDGYSLRPFFIPYNENYILVVDEEEEMVLRKNNICLEKEIKGMSS